MIICHFKSIKSITNNTIKNWIDFVICHHINLLEILCDAWSSHFVSFNNSHVSHSIHLLNINVIKFLQVLLNFRLCEFLIGFKSKYVVIDILSGAPQYNFFLKKFIFWMLSGEIFISWDLNS